MRYANITSIPSSYIVAFFSSLVVIRPPKLQFPTVFSYTIRYRALIPLFKDIIVKKVFEISLYQKSSIGNI